MFIWYYLKYNFEGRREELRVFFKIARKALSEIIRGKKILRTQELVEDGYEKDWEFLPASMKLNVKPGPMRIDNGRIFMWRSIDRRRFLLQEVSGLLKSLQTKSFLEIGSGNGINVLALAVLCPEISVWRGLELTHKGVEVAKKFIQNPPIEVLTFLTGKSADEVKTTLQKLDIDFVVGDMQKMPFADASFDCIFTQHAIEQVPHVYPVAFREARRVAKYAIFIEPFAEAQRRLTHWLYVIYSDYFRASYHEVEKAGFKVLKFEPIISKAKHGSGLLLCG